MPKKRVIAIGLVGLGVVGQGVWKHIQRNRKALERRFGVKLDLRKAAVRDLDKRRSVRVHRSRLTDDPFSIIRDDEIDIVCELVGGTVLAKQVTLEALSRGKIVVSANKALICEHGNELLNAMKQGGGRLYFEASVAGGIPIIKVIREGLVANRFDRIYGILNGTCNYILTRMEREGLTFKDTVDDARRLGYVEADDSLDLDGWDTAHKAVILAYLAYGRWVSLKQVPVEGIRQVTLEDIKMAKDLGYRIKLLGIVTFDVANKRILVRVHPSLVPKERVLASVNEVYNGISVNGDIAGTTLHIGRGAGQDATASAVISDITDAVAALTIGNGSRSIVTGHDSLSQAEIGVELTELSEVRGEYYIRLLVDDRPGVLAEVASEMAEHGVSISSVIQPKGVNKSATLILTTHTSNEWSMLHVVKDLEMLKCVKKKPFLLRIINFED